MLRQGVLLAMVAVFVTNTMVKLPVPPSPGHWSAGVLVAMVGVVSVLAAYGFRTAQRIYSGRSPELAHASRR
jgi:hypothetical protein